MQNLLGLAMKSVIIMEILVVIFLKSIVIFFI